MFSSEMWFNPDIPLGSNLWTSTPEKMEDYISQCNALGQIAGQPCNGTLSKNIAKEDEETNIAPSLVDYLPIDTEPNFLVPNRREIGELFPLYYRGSGERVKDVEAYGIALPPELLEEFQAYIDRNGMLEHARRLIYEEGTICGWRTSSLQVGRWHDMGWHLLQQAPVPLLNFEWDCELHFR